MLKFKDQPGWTYVFGPSYPSNLRKVHPFSRQSIHKPPKSDNDKIYWAKIHAGLEKILHEYCSNSSIHGMNHIGSKRSLIERIWWMAVCVLSVYGCGMLIHKIYHKWDEHPVIVSFDERPVPVWKIPFPAITICPEAKIHSGYFNFTESLYRYAHSDEVLDKKTTDLLMTVLQTCDDFFHRFDKYYKLYSNETLDFVTLLEKISVKKNETFITCWREKNDCMNNFNELLTEEGVCFTYNGFSSEDMFRSGTLHSDYRYMNEWRSSANWSLENGYKEGTNRKSYPRRGSGAGSRLTLQMTTLKQDIEAHCTEEQGFRVAFHSPDEYPMMSKKFIMLSLGRDINIAILPQILTTAKELRNYPSTRRQCLFNDERQLKFFRVYNQNNCELECIVNHTLKVCGCVMFSMPHSQGTRVCSTREINCVLTAELDLLQTTTQDQLDESSEVESACNCLPACSSIQYQTEVTQSMYNFEETIVLRLSPFFEGVANETSLNQISKISVYFKGSQFIASRRSELYGMTDFVASCGGIMGLCLGVSLFSLVELLYYCIVRPLLLVRKTIRRSQQAIEAKEKLVGRF